MKTHHQSVYEQFDEQANSYLTSAVHASGEDLEALQKYLSHSKAANVLDLGCGAGHVSFNVAPKVQSVTAFDLSDSMLEVVKNSAKERGLNNISTVKGNVESLPFDSQTFDLIISRYSAHHWHDVEQALREVRRVLKPNGRVIFIDVVSPGHPVFDLYLQTVEVLRDTSHVRDYPAGEWIEMFNNARLFLKNSESFRLRLEFTSWIERMRTPKVFADAILAYQATLSSDIKTYFEIDEDGSFTSDVMLFELHK
ncbi:class I SAM-dependent methyltransferase [Ignatzschineria rhizosphaerae]|uniref:Class I SAM-dependent methyltransferase n=1 Tax=Ignatzschineria rhizosphaerae TaxID=2923279 RepID=A0ABY3X3D4_9GAMM|nr:class I SAM-dependent methyltransferase [Ignatzschineria rhizosphaerae]UNM97392.1 class I SAM-dependent methyltransferase [Ignatzschineria rhizosphaerae]